MAQTVRMKFECVAITSPYPGSSQKVVRLEARYDPTIPEDQRFLVMTPTAHLEAQIDNPVAFSMFQPGCFFYGDFTPVDAPGVHVFDAKTVVLHFPEIDPKTGQVAA